MINSFVGRVFLFKFSQLDSDLFANILTGLNILRFSCLLQLIDNDTQNLVDVIIDLRILLVIILWLLFICVICVICVLIVRLVRFFIGDIGVAANKDINVAAFLLVALDAALEVTDGVFALTQLLL